MGIGDHWHPVLRSSELGDRPALVTIGGEDLAVFRTPEGLGALRDACPHRGMSLSRGRVEGGRLVCPYHGWSYDRAGVGRVPAQPKASPCATRWDAVERYGAVWVKAHGAVARFPSFNFTSHYAVRTFRHRVRAPLEVVLDNFCEVEHTPTTHALLGYALDRMHEVVTRLELTDETVRVVNTGPQKPLPRVVEALFGMRRGDLFTDDWTTWFSPVHAVYDQFWSDPKTGVPRGDRVRVAVFFTPVERDETDVFSFVYGAGPRFERPLVRAVLAPILARLVDLEVRLDRRMVERMADGATALTGRRLGRFDKALAENRRRLARIYYGVPPEQEKSA